MAWRAAGESAAVVSIGQELGQPVGAEGPQRRGERAVVADQPGGGHEQVDLVPHEALGRPAGRPAGEVEQGDRAVRSRPGGSPVPSCPWASRASWSRSRLGPRAVEHVVGDLVGAELRQRRPSGSRSASSAVSSRPPEAAITTSLTGTPAFAAMSSM